MISSGIAGIEEDGNNGLLGNVEYGDGGGRTKVVGKSDCVKGGGCGFEGNVGGGIEGMTSVSYDGSTLPGEGSLSPEDLLETRVFFGVFRLLLPVGDFPGDFFRAPTPTSRAFVRAGEDGGWGVGGRSASI